MAGQPPSGCLVLATVLLLAAQRQFGVLAQGEEESLDRLRITRCSKRRVPAFALPDPDCFQPPQATRTDWIDLRHVSAAVIANQLFRACRLNLGLCLSDAVGQRAALFGLSHIPTLDCKGAKDTRDSPTTRLRGFHNAENLQAYGNIRPCMRFPTSPPSTGSPWLFSSPAGPATPGIR